MSTGSQSGLEQAERLCDVLERIAGALVELDNEALLAAESTLAELVSAFQTMAPCAAADRAAVEATVHRGRSALMRCRRLGASYTGIARARLSASATLDTYNSVGAVAESFRPVTDGEGDDLMSFLLGSLSAAARALEAQSYGLEVTGQNIANINTPGYARRTVNFAEVPPTDPLKAGGGVVATGVTAYRAMLIEARLWHEQPSASEQGAIADNLSVVEAALGTNGTSIDKELNDFFDAFSALAQDPTSQTARFQVAAKGQSLAQAFNAISSGLTAAQKDADTQLRAGVTQVNALAAQLATINTQLSGAGSAAAEALKDQQSTVLQSLSQLIDISVIQHEDGSADISIGNGRALVVGANVYGVTATSAGPQGFATLSTGGFDISAEISGGSIGGQLRVRDTLVPGYRASLDQLAYGVATAVNTAHQAGYDLNGAAGGAFFAPLATATGAAAAIAVNAAVAGDTRLIAAGGTATAGDNQAARAIANLRSAALPGGGTPLNGWSSLVYQVGADRQAASQEQTSRGEVVKQLQNLRDQTSGVSMDEEAAAMMKFQRAYEANARFFSAVNQSFDTLIQMVAL